jgi:hypothetical protein
MTYYVHPAASDGASSVIGDAISAWGAMVVATAAPSGGSLFAKLPSYVSTAAAAVTRFNDTCTITLPDPSWHDPTQGTLFVDFSLPFGNGCNTSYPIGIGNTTSDYLGIQVQISANLLGANNNIYGTIVAGAVSQPGPIDNGAITAFDTPIRTAMAYKQGDFTALCVNGRPVQQSASVPTAWPAAPVRLVLGWPWQAAMGGLDIRRVAYFPRKLTNAQLIDLTI